MKSLSIQIGRVARAGEFADEWVASAIIWDHLLVSRRVVAAAFFALRPQLLPAMKSRSQS